jgi:4-methylaminobutanoate oxidase (formaldehyde-forming)
MYVVTEPMAQLPNPLPVVRDLDAGIYIKGDTGKLVLGGVERDAKLWDPTGADGDQPYLVFPEDWDQFEPFMEAGLTRVPTLAEAGIQTFMNGPESFTPDSRPLLGESPYLRGLFVAAGMNTTGMMSSAGVGKVMAEWLTAGEPPMDVWDLDIARFDHRDSRPDYLAARMREAVADTFAMHWPHKQPMTGRNLRRVPHHDDLEKAGAVFGVPAGWERPLWYACGQQQRTQTCSYGDQPWWPMAEHEVSVLQNGVVLLELTPFGKLDVTGPGALSLLQTVCANDVDAACGAAVYTQLLNDRGGIEADVTVTRFAAAQFRVTGGAGTRRRDLRWLQRCQERLGVDAVIEDKTETECVFGVMGPKARALLEDLTGADLSPAAFPFASSRVIEIAGVDLRATRLSFVGEAGWELYVGWAHAKLLYRVLVEAGKPHGLAHLGHLALDSCRMEKGYRHWGHDIGPDSTPLEAGLGFAVAWEKDTDFIGRGALMQQRESGLRQRLMMFAVQNEHPLLLHDEPVYRDGERVSSTTSGARGFRTGLSLCMAYVPCAGTETVSSLCRHTYELGVAGETFSLRPLRRPPYDPEGKRLRA